MRNARGAEIRLPAESPLSFIALAPTTISAGLAEFRHRLDHTPMDESRDVLSLFAEFPALGALIITPLGLSAFKNILAIRNELKVGFFRADLLIADLARNSYLLVEFEHGHSNAIFQQGERITPEWSETFEHGYSQVVDWFWWLDNNKTSSDYKRIFVRPNPKITGLLVAGRSLPEHETEMQERLEWRVQRTVINSNHIIFMNYDELYDALEASWEALVATN